MMMSFSCLPFIFWLFSDQAEEGEEEHHPHPRNEYGKA
jgi:hypothetical protein